ncbi:hypothetical protein CROQUDRAFT_714057 [Cronartium quercuum f. sp. fusiforme G11]|uniref:Uncharacterized protein n=1 Tax=Cronartium quercuum f. sp. fusiforme G11 TaxID=708437 RepID=A0A9P6NTJ7_9BASI|nr:hypothetical protein CROQUDRAFT_714057 [Cronartium quercuum f. sp. fusiforme G11]
MDDPPFRISFQPVSASNLPLGLENATEHAELQTDPPLRFPSPVTMPSLANQRVIDLTNDSDPTPSTSRARPHNSRRRRHIDSNEDIIFTGQSEGPREVQRPHRRNGRTVSRVPPDEPAPRPRSVFMENVANLTAGIEAGQFSSYPQLPPDPTPAQGPSTIIIRDSPPLQVRRNPNPTASFGGGGLISGGFFSGLIAAGITTFRQLSQFGEHIGGHERLFLDWSDPGHRNTPGQHAVGIGREQLFAAMADFGVRNGGGMNNQPAYATKHSHPHRISSGFSKEIIPLDREFLMLDSDSQSIDPVKQEAKPICASCDQLLLLGQESSTSTSEGRRPWILACGHVVDSKCLEDARERARAERRARMQKARAKKASKGGRGRKRPAPSITNEGTVATSTMPGALTSFAINTTTKRQRFDSIATTSTPHDLISAFPSKSDCASMRETRARAREARRSTDGSCASPKPSAQSLDLSQAGGSSRTNKGKGKQIEPRSDVGMLDLASDGPGVIEKDPLPAPEPCLSLLLTWLQCPVKGCKGPKGDVLAKKGAKNAPWEIYV